MSRLPVCLHWNVCLHYYVAMALLRCHGGTTQIIRPSYNSNEDNEVFYCRKVKMYLVPSFTYGWPHILHCTCEFPVRRPLHSCVWLYCEMISFESRNSSKMSQLTLCWSHLATLLVGEFILLFNQDICLVIKKMYYCL